MCLLAWLDFPFLLQWSPIGFQRLLVVSALVQISLWVSAVSSARRSFLLPSHQITSEPCKVFSSSALDLMPLCIIEDSEALRLCVGNRCICTHWIEHQVIEGVNQFLEIGPGHFL